MGEKTEMREHEAEYDKLKDNDERAKFRSSSGGRVEFAWSST